ncbi:spermine oxidase-like [Maniola hyperantus]|uniref:spermine oxidase-like n=1 Tax=Aphantopus hyperantus TaxID=2795564 RepID=UPI00156909DF|nr:spermine oxidase-like [Maniola hyperantus]
MDKAILIAIMNRRLLWISLASILGQATCLISVVPQQYDTIVIGLGSAGTTAASTLARAGKRVLALEAQDRIGGRVWTVPFGDGLVEVGGEWIHGTKDSRVYEQAIKNNISAILQETTLKVYKSDGSEGNADLFEELVTFCLEAQDDPPETPQTIGKFLTRKLKDYLKEKHPHLLQDEAFLNEFLEIMNYISNSLEAANDWDDVSLQTTNVDLVGYKTMSWHRHGYKTFFELLLNTYNNGPGLPTLEIKLNTEVTQIKWPKDSTGKVEVVCKDGAVYTADNVIVTVSLGVLKERYSTLFSPPLPEEKVTAINKLGFGVVGKTIFSFSEPWWPDVMTFFFFWNPEDREAYKEDPWMLKIKQVLRPMGSSNTLTFWANGDQAKLIETLPEDVVKSKMMQLLQRFMGKNMTIPEPTGMIRSKWYSNPFTRGCYSHDTVPQMVEYPNARATLAEPLLDAEGSPKVLFAGEASETKRFATVHGASDSGLREARRLLSSKA